MVWERSEEGKSVKLEQPSLNREGGLRQPSQTYKYVLYCKTLAMEEIPILCEAYHVYMYTECKYLINYSRLL